MASSSLDIVMSNCPGPESSVTIVTSAPMTSPSVMPRRASSLSARISGSSLAISAERGASSMSWMTVSAGRENGAPDVSLTVSCLGAASWMTLSTSS